jgi:serine/threonine-protein kinase
MSGDDDLLRIAGEIADRTPVDWGQHTTKDAAEAARLEGLKLVESVALAYGSVMETTADDREPSTLDVVQGVPEDALFQWGHLRVLEKLGEGSFGEVFRAYDPLLDREVALKLRHAQDLAPPASAREFIREARLLARVRHPNVVVVHGADTHDGRIGMWTDLVTGRTLEQFLTDEGPMSAQSVALIGLDLCRALAAVHGAGLVHGDVKAANVMRERGGRIVLMDFGAGLEFARGSADRAAAGPRGTPLAMAPEVLHGGALTPASDLYSLGALLYRLASGCHPIEAETLGELIERSRSTHITPLRDARADLPAQFVAVIERALARDPADRYQTAGAMEHALLSWIAPVGAQGVGDGPSRMTNRPGDDRVGDERAARGIVRSRPLRPRRIGAALALVAAAAVGIFFAANALRTRRPAPSRQVRSIAVLPFQTLDPDVDADVLGVGIADALINRLSRLPEITVSPTSAVLRFANAHPDPQVVGNALGVETVLEGRVQRSGGRTRVTAQLVRASGGKPMWAGTFDQPSTNIFELEDSLSEQLVRALRLHLSDLERADLAWRPTTSAEAYQDFLMGGHFASKCTAASLRKGADYFEQATRHDPGFSRAYAGLAEALCALPGIEAAPADPGEVYPRAIEAARTALSLDPELAEGHVVLALVAMRHDWDWTKAQAELLGALDLDPSCARAHQALAEFHSVRGEHEQAISEIRVALESDPLSLPANALAGRIYERAGLWVEAAEQLKRALEIEPSFHLVYTYLADADVAHGRLDEAVSNWQNAMALSGRPPDEVTALGRAYASGGMTGAWRWRLERLQQSAAGGEYVPPALLARAHAAVGEREAAFRWLSGAVETHDEFLLGTIDEPAFDGIRSDARFAALLRRLPWPAARR